MVESLRRRITMSPRLEGAVATVDAAGAVHADELPSNRVTTSRYTLLTFVPLNLWEQLQRPLNVYFVAVSVLLCIPVIAPVSPITVTAPLLVAFAIAGAKEAVDDMHRHRGDRVTNSRTVWRLDFKARVLRPVASETLHVGDLVLLLSGDVVPCDVVPLLTDDPVSGNAYCNTANLDGESDAKIKHAVLSHRLRAKPADVVAELSRRAKVEASQLPPPASTVGDTAVEPGLDGLFQGVVEALSSFSIECEPPSRVLSSFVGELVIKEDSIDAVPQRIPLTIDELLVSTSSVVNTAFVLGCVIYTGNDSKVHRSRKDQPPKWSAMERLTNKFAVSVFLLQLLGVVILTMLFYVNLRTHSAWYLPSRPARSSAFQGVFIPMRCFLLLSVMVPLSVKITLELSKFYISQVIEWDLDLYDEVTDTPAVVNNRALAEELGLVRFVFADKTGTLTENSMTLRALAFATSKGSLILRDGAPVGHKASPSGSELLTADAIEALSRDERALHMLLAIACNNSCEVVTASSTAGVEASLFSYQSTSPDEAALVGGLSQVGVVLQHRIATEVRVRIASTTETVRILATAPFTSARGAMSVLTQRDGVPGSVLYVKGSDERLATMQATTSSGGDSTWNTIAKIVDELAAEGLRTLVFASKELSNDETTAWLNELRAAELLQDARQRTEAVARCWVTLEKGLHVVGATAVEDMLQADVPATIASLRQANIRVWMLTGDKHSTAVQTGKLSGLLQDDDPIYTFDVDPSQSHDVQQRALSEQLKLFSSKRSAGTSTNVTIEIELPPCETEPKSEPLPLNPTTTPTAESRGYDVPSSAAYTIVVTGRALRALEAAVTLLCDFEPVLFHAATVICCRMTPDQKALIVALMQRRGVLCLAIGDGGNDVPMIQAADVGIGIAGVEGRQAVQAADYAIAKFRFLAPLLLTHGHTAVMRSAFLVQFIFYKSIIIGLIQAFYNSWCSLSSGVSFFDSVALTLYNGVFTLLLSYLPVLDTHLPRGVLLSDPTLYLLSQSGHYMNRMTFLRHLLRSFVHAVLIFFTAKFIFNGDFVGHAGRPYAILDGEYVSVLVPLVLVQCAIVAMESHSITLMHAVFIPFTFLTPFIFYAPYSALLKRARFYGLFDVWMGHAPMWLATLLIAGVVLIPLTFVAAVKFYVRPDALQRCRQNLFLGPGYHRNHHHHHHHHHHHTHHRNLCFPKGDLPPTLT